ncbi:MAG: hypothetical protein ABW185_07915 [Sedimenticola sp.]
MLHADQLQLNADLDWLNGELKKENNRKQLNNQKGCQTISWHSDIRRSSIVKRMRDGTVKRKLKNNFKDLYDGIHAVSELKHRWHTRVINTCEQELTYTDDEKNADSISSTQGDPHSCEAESSDSEEENWDFKRQRRTVTIYTLNSTLCKLVSNM